MKHNEIIDILMKVKSIPMSWGVKEFKYLSDSVLIINK